MKQHFTFKRILHRPLPKGLITNGKVVQREAKSGQRAGISSSCLLLLPKQATVLQFSFLEEQKAKLNTLRFSKVALATEF